ncbi:MAG: dihydrofolate reductase family protein [Acidimicrobiales bacterium]
MTRVRVGSFSVSLDGFGAGPQQGEANPLGVGGRQLHDWIFATSSGRRMIGETGGSVGVDDAMFKGNLEIHGSTIMGRNMFGPVRGPWGDRDWRGWWGDEPPFHNPVFVLTHYERSDLVMGDTTFHFVTGGLKEALAQAREAAGDGDIHVGGGVATIRMLLDARLIDEMWLAIVPVQLGAGERLFSALERWPVGYERGREIPGELVTHLEFIRVDAP